MARRTSPRFNFVQLPHLTCDCFLPALKILCDWLVSIVTSGMLHLNHYVSRFVIPTRDMTIPIDKWAPEVLQAVWRHLSLFDLMRCQQVCNYWKVYLPRNDPALRRALFLPTAAPRELTLGTICWPIAINYEENTVTRPGPRLWQILTLELIAPEEYYSAGEDEVFHPIITRLYDFAHLVHPEFSSGPFGSTFEFDSPYGVRRFTDGPDEGHASWRHMLACVPAVGEAYMHLAWGTTIFSGKAWICTWEIFKVENPAGISVWDFVMVLREALRNAWIVVPSLWAARDHLA